MAKGRRSELEIERFDIQSAEPNHTLSPNSYQFFFISTHIILIVWEVLYINFLSTSCT